MRDGATGKSFLVLFFQKITPSPLARLEEQKVNEWLMALFETTNKT
jgi:hypothetical protein